MKIALGFICGLVFSIVGYLCYSHFVQPKSYDRLKDSIDSQLSSIAIIQNKNEINSSKELEVALIRFEDEIKSIDKRTDDFYIVEAIVVALVLAISISVYIKTEDEVSKHMTDNFDKYKQRIESMAASAEEKFNEISAKAALADKIMKQVQKGTQTTQQP